MNRTCIRRPALGKKIILIFLAVLCLFAFPFRKQISAAEKSADDCGKFGEQTVDLDIGNLIYGISESRACGTTNIKGEYIDFEGFAGLKVQTEGKKATATLYCNASDKKPFKTGELTIKRYNRNEYGAQYTFYVPINHENDPKDGIEYSLGELKPGQSVEIDLEKLPKKMGLKNKNGLYILTVTFPNEQYAVMNLYFDGEKVLCCRHDPGVNTEHWNSLIGDLDPEKCVNMYVGSKKYPLTYPTSGNNGYCVHVDEWCELSDTIVKKDDWSDELKVFAFVDYLIKNYAYDDWRVYTNDNKSRATLKQDWSDDNLWMYYNHVGQCWDFANVLTIMCRHHGIPCTSVENDSHAVNAVWLGGHWVAIDVTGLLKYRCTEEDTDREKWVYCGTGVSFRRDYGYCESSMSSLHQSLTTPSTATGGSNPK
ncbi:MAG: transglutaminase-like domain-containing protein [Lachnospiraceae bacterium]|nr:transglutaminase-like domain-containing protein [Lachnospiraceae bacterium]